MRTQQLKEVNLPYLGCNTGEEVMDFLLVETQQLLFRFTSLASTLKTFRVPISPDKVEKLRRISTALVGISELIKSHKSAAQMDVEDCLDRDGWEATWGSRTGRNGGFDDIIRNHFTLCCSNIEFYAFHGLHARKLPVPFRSWPCLASILDQTG
uniref:Uncharacterized protein n=1 Tax=Aegilops tauschii subsp. strangulata TaxID=200361 RepID=A0A453DLR0_AEGTS